MCAIAAYLLASEVKDSPQAGLIAAGFMATVPTYMSRSVAGSFDNEGVAIFALTFVFYLYVKTLKTGSLRWATALALAYLYMVASWGGYNFIVNLIPIHAFGMLVLGRYSGRLYIAFTTFVLLGTGVAVQVPVVGFNAVTTSEHFAGFLMFVVLNLVAFVRFLRQTLSARAYARAKGLAIAGGVAALAAAAAAVAGHVAASPTLGWTGRSLSLLDPTYASKYIPIIASVSEHQPPAWPSYLMDLHFVLLLMPLGLVACFRPLTDASLFLAVYGVVAVYFSGVMVRLLLVLSPAACCLAGIGASEFLDACCASIKAHVTRRRWFRRAGGGEGGGAELKGLMPLEAAIVGVALFLGGAVFYACHCTYLAAENYSAPSIVIKSGNGVIFDDFREGYAWLRQNTDDSDKVASWWDYGYQTTAMADRTVLVDNNTWNNTHIATVGMAMSSPEEEGWLILRDLDVKYVFVIFGGLIGYSSDDINKFLWMVRIGGGEFPHIKEKDFLNSRGGYSMDQTMSETMANSLMFKLTYFNYDVVSATFMGKAQMGVDRVRNVRVGNLGFPLRYFEEAFSSKYLMIRIYRVLDAPLEGAPTLEDVERQHRAKRKASKKP